jgi:hypothetical protein
MTFNQISYAGKSLIIGDREYFDISTLLLACVGTKRAFYSLGCLNGFTKRTPSPLKIEVLRVATVKLLALAVAAIIASEPIRNFVG